MNLPKAFLPISVAAALGMGVAAAASAASSVGATLQQDETSLLAAQAQLNADLIAKNAAAVSKDRQNLDALLKTVQIDENAVAEALINQNQALQQAQKQLAADLREGDVSAIAGDVAAVVAAQQALQQASAAIGLTTAFPSDFGFVGPEGH